MSNLSNWAMDQIRRLDITEERKNQYRTILDVFSEQGHSGFSASYALSYINKYLEEGYEKVKQILDGMQSLITKDILELIDLFRKYNLGKEEASKISRLMNWKPIIYVNGTDDEWGPADKFGGKVTQQNKVCSAIFRDNYDNKTAHYIDGRVYSDNGGHSWFTGNHKNGVIRSHINIEFPYWVPDKPEYIYLNGEDSEEIITDKARIKELYDDWNKRIGE